MNYRVTDYLKKSIFTLFLLLLVLLLKAQNKNPLDQIYSPPKTSFFGEKNLTLSQEQNSKGEGCKNMIRLSITDFARSQARLVYERKLGNYFSATAGIGFSFGSDIIENRSSNAFESLINESDDGIKLLYLQENASRKSGIIYSTSLKYNYKKYYPTAYFIELGYKYVHINYQSLGEIYGIPVSNSQFDVNHHNFSLSCGYSWTYDGDKMHFTHELSYGIGMKYYSWDKYIPSDIKDADGRSVSYNQQPDQILSNNCYIFTLRYQMGIGW